MRYNRVRNLQPYLGILFMLIIADLITTIIGLEYGLGVEGNTLWLNGNWVLMIIVSKITFPLALVAMCYISRKYVWESNLLSFGIIILIIWQGFVVVNNIIVDLV